MKSLTFWAALLFIETASFGQDVQVIAGPMPGYSEIREAVVWVQLSASAKVRMEYYYLEKSDTISAKTAEVVAFASNRNIAHLVAGPLEPGMIYNYRIFADDIELEIPEDCSFKAQSQWKHFGDPPDFRMLLGSCNYVNEEQYDRPGKPYGGVYGIFQEMTKMEPDLMLWLGDNTYLKPADLGSRTGILERYEHTRSNQEVQEFLRSTHHYAIWDDHDFGPNNSDRSFVNKEFTQEAFELFWANPPSSWDLGIATMFRFYDIDIFLLDDRSYRTQSTLTTNETSILGGDQIDILIEALKYSQSPFKLVAMGGQFLNTAKVHENYANYPDEREMIIKRIEKENIEGVIFLSGDRHAAELSKLEFENGGSMYDFTVSPLTASPHNNEDEGNTLRVSGTYYPDRNFGMIEFSGPIGDRKATLTIHGSKGKVVWEHVIDQHQIRGDKR